jgi:hypothetical protein
VPLGAKPCAVPPLIWLESITSFLAPILLEILIMTDFMRALNHHVERVFNPSSKETHWGRRKLARDR